MSALKDRPKAHAATGGEVTVRVSGKVTREVQEALDKVKIPASMIQPVLENLLAAFSLAPVMESAEVTASPQMARSLQARENWLRSIEKEFGALTRQQVAEMRGSKGTNRSMAAAMQAKGLILDYRRGNSFKVPAFQFTETGEVRPAVPLLIDAARQAGWDDMDLLIWLTNPNTHFPEGKRPVDVLDNTDRVLEVFTATVGEQ